MQEETEEKIKLMSTASINKNSSCFNSNRVPAQVEVVQFADESHRKGYKEDPEESNIEEEKYLKFLDKIIETGGCRPIIIKGCDIGPCSTKWTVDYLKNTDSNKLVKVHRSPSPQLDFRKKNFKYETITFSKLVENCSKGSERQISDNSLESDDLEGSKLDYYYLRSLGVDPRGRDISDLATHFPELYKDIRIPQLFPKSSFFSSVFRITSPSLQLWTHYDTCHNILIQIKGRKRIVLFPPWEALNLYLDGDKSEIIEIDNPDLELYPLFSKVERFEGILEEGDIVFIPSLWFHNIIALDFSVSVNVFWRNLEQNLYDKKDTYGNHDVIPAQLGFRTLDKAAAQLKALPLEYQDFYLRRMIISLQKKLDNIHSNDI